MYQPFIIQSTIQKLQLLNLTYFNVAKKKTKNCVAVLITHVQSQFTIQTAPPLSPGWTAS